MREPSLESDARGEVSALDRVGEDEYVGGQHAVLLERLDELANEPMAGNGAATGTEGRAMVEPLRGAHQLDGENISHVAHDAAQLPRGAHRHGHNEIGRASCRE